MKLKKIITIIAVICVATLALVSCAGGTGTENNESSIVDGAVYTCESLITVQDPELNIYKIKFNSKKNTMDIDVYKADGETLIDCATLPYEVLGEVDQYTKVRYYFDEEKTEKKSNVIYLTKDMKFLQDFMLSLPQDNLTYEYTNNDNVKFVITFNTEKKEFDIEITKNGETTTNSGIYKVLYNMNDSLDLNLIPTTGPETYDVVLLKDKITSLLVVIGEVKITNK